MEFTNILWILSFSLILISLHWLYGMIIKYIEDKPLGCQSLYDVLLRDHFMVARSTGSIYCLLAISSRFDCLATILNSNQVRVNFPGILRVAFTQTDPKRAKNTVQLSVLFALLESLCVKAARKMLVKFTPVTS